MTNDVYDNIPTKVITVLTCISVLTIGNILWFGIIHFELYGGDPKKRSITNKARELVYSYKNKPLIWHLLPVLDYDIYHGYIMTPRYLFMYLIFSSKLYYDTYLFGIAALWYLLVYLLRSIIKSDKPNAWKFIFHLRHILKDKTLDFECHGESLRNQT